MSAATANLVGITGITRRLVIDGVLSEADARKALDEATKAKKQAHLYLLENKLVNHAQVAAANSIEFGMPLFDASAMDLRYSAVKLVSEELIQKHGALPLFRRTGDHTGEANTLNNLGVAQERLGQYRPAIDYYEQALTLSRQRGDRTGEARALNNLAVVLWRQNHGFCCNCSGVFACGPRICSCWSIWAAIIVLMREIFVSGLRAITTSSSAIGRSAGTAAGSPGWNSTRT